MSPVSNDVWRKNTALAWREIEEETIIISPSDSVMHELNDTGSFLWSRIDGKRTTADLADLLAQNYEVTREAALADTTALLAELATKKLVVAADTEDH